MGSAQFCYLTHFTRLQNLYHILGRGALLTPVERIQKHVTYVEQGLTDTSAYENGLLDPGEYPGIYMSLFAKDDIGRPLDAFEDWLTSIKDGVYLVFSLALLKRLDYHVNSNDNYGFIDEHTYVNQTLNQYPRQKDVKQYWDERIGRYKGNECVFHHTVQTYRFLQEIWVVSPELQAKVQSMVLLPSNVKVRVTSVVPPGKAMRHWRKFKPSGEELQPNFCWAPQIQGRKIATVRTVKALAADCGLPRKDLRNLPESNNGQQYYSYAYSARDKMWSDYIVPMMFGKLPIPKNQPFVPPFHNKAVQQRPYSSARNARERLRKGLSTLSLPKWFRRKA